MKMTLWGIEKTKMLFLQTLNKCRLYMAGTVNWYPGYNKILLKILISGEKVRQQ